MEQSSVRAGSHWLDVVLDVLSTLRPVVPWDAVCEELGRQLESPVAGDYRWRQDGTAIVHAYPFPDSFDLGEVASRAPRHHPLALRYSATGVTEPLSMDSSHVRGRADVRRYCDELAADGIGCQLWIPVDRDDQEIVVVGVCRPGDAYTEAELRAAREAQEVVAALHRHCQTLAWLLRRTGEPAQAEAVVADLGLTARQVAVLALTAEGLTAVAVAHRLRCSPRTVEKHLQNAYARLGVRDRVTAVRAVERAGLLRPRDRLHVPAPRGAHHAGQA